MDTPDRNHNQTNSAGTTPTTKIEQDSPVFNFINSLSPIKTVKSAQVNQIFTSLNFSSLPSIFTTPHVKSRRESRFLKCHQSPGATNSKPDLQIENSTCCNEEVSGQLYDNSDELQDIFDPGSFIVDETPGKQFKNVSELPDGNATPCDTDPDTAKELVDSSNSKYCIPVVPVTSESVPEDNSRHQEILQGVEELCADWDGLIPNATDQLIFSSPANAETFEGLMQLEPEANIGSSNLSGYPQDDINGMQNKQLVDPVGPGEQHEIVGLSVQPRKLVQLAATGGMHENLAVSEADRHVTSSMGEKTENEVSYMHCGIPRRCLDFEVVGGHGSTEFNESNATSLLTPLSQSDEKVNPFDKQLVPLKPRTDASRCALPGLGLHLNAVGTTSKEYKYMKYEAFYSGKPLLKLHSSSSSNASQTDQDAVNKSLGSISSEGDIQASEIRHQLAEPAHESPIIAECKSTSPKNKRRKLEAAGESEACKRCNCKKSKCLKLYCECFAAGVYCIDSCSCQDCFNNPVHEDTVLATRKQIESRNPLAFSPKVIMTTDFTSETGDESSKTPASARHKRGCNCKKSSCLKKYCECYQGGVGCSINCRCESCKNVFGRKEGSALKETHVEAEIESETCERTMMGKSSQQNKIQERKQKLPASANSKTPLQLDSPLVQLPFSSNSKPPRSSSCIVGSSSGLSGSHKLGNPGFLQPQPKFENQLPSVPEDEVPEALHDEGSPGSGVKTASPNRKRVSPPSCDSGSSPARWGGRKLILQSIPSFPSLTPQH